jgi:hypothetical protein
MAPLPLFRRTDARRRGAARFPRCSLKPKERLIRARVALIVPFFPSVHWELQYLSLEAVNLLPKTVW